MKKFEKHMNFVIFKKTFFNFTFSFWFKCRWPVAPPRVSDWVLNFQLFIPFTLLAVWHVLYFFFFFFITNIIYVVSVNCLIFLYVLYFYDLLSKYKYILLLLGRNTLLISIFRGCFQFGPYILISFYWVSIFLTRYQLYLWS